MISTYRNSYVYTGFFVCKRIPAKERSPFLLSRTVHAIHAIHAVLVVHDVCDQKQTLEKDCNGNENSRAEKTI